MKTGKLSLLGAVAIAALVTAGLLDRMTQDSVSRFSFIESAQAAGGMVKGPNEVAPDRYVYYPGTEVLAKDEVRVVACGTGMPDARRGQASACFLFEFGNGEKIIFDIGTGSMRNINSLMIPAEYLTKIILSHLHTDHWGDLDFTLGRRLDRRSAGAAGGLGAEWTDPGDGH